MTQPAPTLPCRTCFWSAELTATEPRVWCAHAACHGWMTDRPACGGGAYVERRPWHSSIAEFQRYAGIIA